GDLQYPPTGLVAVMPVRFLGQRRLQTDLGPQFVGDGLDRLNAPQSIGGVRRGRSERQQLAYKELGLRSTVLVHRAISIVPFAPFLTARGAVSDDQQRLGIGGQLREPA